MNKSTRHMKRKYIQRKKKTLFILSCIVVFMTVYSLVLPAITINKETAEEDNGIVLNDEYDTVSHNEESVVDSENTDNQAGDSSAFSNQSGSTENKTKEFNELLKGEQEKEKQMVEKISYPSVSFSDTLNDAIVRVSAPEGAFPEGTVMKIEEVKEDLSKTLADVVDNKPIESYKAIDISFYIGEEKIEPLVPIEVSITSSFIAEEPKDPLLVHIDDKGSTDLVETKQIEEKDVQAINKNEEVKDLVESVDQIDEISKDNTLSFESGSFSVYVLVYTVDFYYEVNGKSFDYSMDGGNAIALSELLDILNVLEDSENDRDIHDFLNDIESLSFSDESLIKILPVETDCSYKELIDQYDLDVEYSSSLSEEDIELLNNKQFNEGDYVLISLRPFLSEERLKINLKSGESFFIRVTDDQIIKDYLAFDGKSYRITLTYDSDAGIPEKSELRVTEIVKEDDEYLGYYSSTLDYIDQQIKNEGNNNVLSQERKSPDLGTDGIEDNVDPYIRLLDIEIVCEGEKIEPKNDVLVNVELIGSPQGKCYVPKIIHFSSNGIETIDSTTNEENSFLSFITNEFSVYSIVYTVDFSFVFDGQEYTFTLDGGDSTSIRELLERTNLLNREEINSFIDSIEAIEFSNPDYLWIKKLEEDAFAGDLKKGNNLEVVYASNMKQGNINAMDIHHYNKSDWVLISLKPFTSNETLKIYMKNGDAFSILVTDAQSDAIHNPDGTVQTVSNPSGTTFDLFNYYVSSDTKTTPGRDQWPGHIHDDRDFWKFNWYDLNGNYLCDWGEGFNRGYQNNNGVLLGYGNNLGINQGHVFKFTPANSGTVIDGTKGTKSVDGDNGGLNSWTGDGDPRQGIVKGTLENGYPVLTNNGNLGTNGTSLKYLFDDSLQNGKDRYEGVDHLLYVDPDGYYTYDSRDFKVHLNDDGKTFTVSDQPDIDDTELKGFWPFGDNVYWSGLHMNTQFSIPKDGKVLNPKHEYKDMQFEFSGDDDTWLYIDGVLVGDGGGIHNRTEIDINFATGKVLVTGKKDTVHTGSFEKEQWLDDIFKAAGKYNESDWEDIGDGSGHKRFKAGTYHTFDMFYLERGGGESNLYIHYNLVSTEDFTAHKAYDGYDENDRMQRDEFKFELIGLDGQYQSVYDETTQTATITKINDTNHAIMPYSGTESGDGTVANPKKVYEEDAWNGQPGYVYTTGVTENGDIRFGQANISAEEMHNCDEGHPSLYRYVIREIVPPDAKNSDGIKWSEATEEQKAQGGFMDQNHIVYDGTVYYMTARVTSWDQTGADGQTYKAYGLSKTYYTDDTFEVIKENVNFVDFRNKHVPVTGNVSFDKIDQNRRPLQGAKFALYTKPTCLPGEIAKDIEKKDLISISDVKGNVSFENVKVGTYYLKEIEAPDGYQLDETVYKTVIEDSLDSSKKSKITFVNDSSEMAITEISNVKPGELSVIKVWQDENGKPVDGGNRVARVKIQRNRYAIDSVAGEHDIRFTIAIQGRGDLRFTATANNVKGRSVSIDWWDTNQDINYVSVKDSSSQDIEYNISNYWDDVNYKNRKMSITNINSDINVYVEYPADKDWLFNSEHTSRMMNVLFSGTDTDPIYKATEDEEFNSSIDDTHFAELSKPNWNKTWTLGNGKDFPVLDDNGKPYLYYVVEVDQQGKTIPINGFDTEETYKLIGYSVNNSIGVNGQGSITVYNEVVSIPANVTVLKIDADTGSRIAGARFYLMNGSAAVTDLNIVDLPNRDPIALDTDNCFTVPINGLMILGLNSGTYTLMEKESPAGYILTNQGWTFTVNPDGTISGDESIIDDLIITIPNEPGKELPHTGGFGTSSYRIIGLSLIFTAELAYMIKRKKH